MPITSEANTLRIEFNSDNSVQKTGFNARFFTGRYLVYDIFQEFKNIKVNISLSVLILNTIITVSIRSFRLSFQYTAVLPNSRFESELKIVSGSALNIQDLTTTFLYGCPRIGYSLKSTQHRRTSLTMSKA